MSVTSPAAAAWDAERGRLFGIAYRMLGDAGEAEDVVSEVAAQALLAERADGAVVGAGSVRAGEPVRSWPAWLTTTCVRRSVDRVRSLAARREEYPGPWLPEPVATDRLPEDVVATRDLLSIGLLHLADQLTGPERAAVVLHRAFAMTGPEIAEILGSTPVAVRQLVSRAERRLEVTADSRLPERADPASVQRLVRAVETGDLDTVLALLEDDAVLFSDGGGKVSAARNPIVGAERIVRFYRGVLAKAARAGEVVQVGMAHVNGEIALDLRGPGRRDLVVLEISPSGRVRAIRQISNPDKLTRV